MPIFEYECKKCGEITEILLKPSDLHPKKCPLCGCLGLKRKFSTFCSKCNNSKITENSCSQGMG